MTGIPGPLQTRSGPADPHRSGRVIALDRFCARRTLSPLRQAEAYWTALRKGNAIPRRSQIDPRGLENILEYTFILERIAPGIARFRLAGQHLASLAGMEVRGMPLTALFSASARPTIGATLEYVFDTASVVELSLSIQGPDRTAGPQAQMGLLPLSSETGETSRALGVLVADIPKSPWPAPVRFDVMGRQVRANPDQISGGSFGGSDGATATEPPRKGAPHLRVVV